MARKPLKNKIQQFGFKLNAIEDPRAYKLGASPLPLVVLQEDGDWSKYLPNPETQGTPNWDTYGCTVYGTENALQILEKRLFGESTEWAERFNYNIAGVNPPGHDPHDIAETFRKSGVIEYGLLPMTKTLEEYRKPRPMDKKLLDKGQEYPYELMHEWLWQRNISQEDRAFLIRNYLKYSPLGVSVTAWSKEGDVYVDRGQRNTHWVVIIGEEKGKGWKIYDSYEPHIKVISYDHNIEVCKRYQLVKKDPQIPLMWKIINKIKELIGLVESQQKETVLPKKNLLLEEAVKWLGKDASPKDLVSDTLACAESCSNIIKQILPDFKIVTGTYSLYENLKKDKRFREIKEQKLGAIIISPTGMGNGAIKNGHVGIFTQESIIASNDSDSGLWSQNFTLNGWKNRYEKNGGYPIYYFEMV